MTKGTDIYHLLVQREGQWVTRDDINFVGGEDAGRRIRELRDPIAAAGVYRLEERVDTERRLEFRLVKIEPIDLAADEDTQVQQRQRYRWACIECGSYPAGATIASIDPRWRMGPCGACRNTRATFKEVTA